MWLGCLGAHTGGRVDQRHGRLDLVPMLATGAAATAGLDFAFGEQLLRVEIGGMLRHQAFSSTDRCPCAKPLL